MSPPRRRDGTGWSWPVSRPRLPGPSAPRAAGRAPFGSTWWGRAWVDALEGRASLDPNRLPRGRTYARSGAVGELTIGAGQVTARVQGSRPSPYRVTVGVRTFTGEEWDRVLDALAAQIGHTAALLDGELPPEVAAEASSVGADLLPGPGDIRPSCSCPDSANPCKHAAAVCYLVADALDRDPFDLLLLRGRKRSELLAALRARRAVTSTPETPTAPETADIDRGVPAREAWTGPRADLPIPPLPPRHPGRPPTLPGDPPPGPTLDVVRIQRLAADAATRALELALGSGAHGLDLSLDEDLARRAAGLLGPRPTPDGLVLVALAAAAGITPAALLRRGQAWQAGGSGALATLDDLWDPGREPLAEGKRLLGRGAWARRNRVTLDDRQLRLGRDGSWYPYRKTGGGQWEPDGPGFPAATRDAGPDLD